MTIKDKKQAASIVAAALCMFIAGLVLLRGVRDPIAPTVTTRVQQAAPDSASKTFAPARAAHADSMPTILAPNASVPAIDSFVITSADSVAAALIPFAPAFNDTMLRYGSHATRMQMLIELLEEKQLLMEEKFELSRRLEVAEILDSALVVAAKPESSASAHHDSSGLLRSSILDSLFSNTRDSLEHTSFTHPDSLRPASFIPPQK